MRAAWWRWSDAAEPRRRGRRQQAPAWPSPHTTDSSQVGAHAACRAGCPHFHVDALTVAVGEVEDVAGEKLDGVDHAHRVHSRPPIDEVAEDRACADGRCKTD